MNPTIFTTRTVRWIRAGSGCCLLLVLSLAAARSQPFPPEKKTEEKKMEDKGPREMPKRKASPAIVSLPVEAGAVEIAFTDGSNLKLQLREEKIALATPHGKLHIVVSDIQRIEFATRASEEDTKQIKTAIADLGNEDFGKRETASTQLLKLREKAYPELLRAAQRNDPETVRRAQELIQQITARVPADRLAVRPKDVVYTTDSMIAGRIEAVSLKAHTSQFGSVQVRLADALSLHSQGMYTNGTNAIGWGSSSRSSSNGMGPQQLEMERRRMQMQQMEMMRRQMNKGWEKK